KLEADLRSWEENGPEGLLRINKCYEIEVVDLKAECDRLREALGKYGGHGNVCPVNDVPHLRGECECGLDTALTPKEPAHE
ncbi:MAG: hypothetical protein V3W44_08410, partial [Dehalococcoidales bacterium]